MNGVGSYNLHVGKNALFQADTNSWKFGVENIINQAWICPDKGINPIGAILGEFNTQIPGMTNTACEPIIANGEFTYYNEYNDRIFGGYKDYYYGISAASVYNPALLKLGCLGFSIETYDADIPWVKFKLVDVDLRLSSVYNMENQPYIIEDYFETYPENFSKVQHASNTIITNTDDLNDALDSAGQAIKNFDDLEKDSKFEITFGKYADWPFLSFTTSGMVKTAKLKEQLPNTANACSLAVPVAKVLAKVMPGVGDAIEQAAKGLPDLPVPDKIEYYFDSPYGYHLDVKTKMKAWSPNSIKIKSGLFSLPTGQPVLWNETKYGAPDLAGIADSLISVGSVFDPIGTLTKLVTEDLPGCLQNIELNTTFGLATSAKSTLSGIPILNGDLVFKKIENFAKSEIGLFKNANFRANLDVLEGSKDNLGGFVELGVQLPTTLTNPNVKLYGMCHALANGIDLSVEAPIINADLTVSLVADKFVTQMSGPTKPKFKFSFNNSCIFDVPAGTATLLGSGIVKSILKLIFGG